MKKLIAILLCLMSCFLCACGNSNAKSSASSAKEENEAKSIDYSALSDDIFSYDVLLDGKKYTLPFSFSELEKEGWTIEDKAKSEELAPNVYIINVNIFKDKEKLTVQFVNNSKEKCAIDKCNIGEITTFGGVAEGKVSLVLPKGISFKATEDEVKAAYGDPSDTDTSTENYNTMTYIQKNPVNEDFQQVNILMDKDKNTVKGFSVKNMFTKDEMNKAQKATKQ